MRKVYSLFQIFILLIGIIAFSGLVSSEEKPPITNICAETRDSAWGVSGDGNIGKIQTDQIGAAMDIDSEFKVFASEKDAQSYIAGNQQNRQTESSNPLDSIYTIRSNEHYDILGSAAAWGITAE